MRVYQRILLVAVLTLAMIAAGVAWERFCIAPFIEQAQQKPDLTESAMDDLPAECLEELATMGQPPASADSQVERRFASTAAATGQTAPAEGGNVLRPSGGANQAATHIEVEDSSLSPRTIHRGQSADWIEPLAQPGGDPRQNGRSARRVAVSAESSLSPNIQSPNGNSEVLKSVDVLDLMRRLRGEDADQRTEARRELVRRGFSEVDLELAQQLFSPTWKPASSLPRRCSGYRAWMPRNG